MCGLLDRFVSSWLKILPSSLSFIYLFAGQSEVEGLQVLDNRHGGIVHFCNCVLSCLHLRLQDGYVLPCLLLSFFDQFVARFGLFTPSFCFLLKQGWVVGWRAFQSLARNSLHSFSGQSRSLGASFRLRCQCPSTGTNCSSDCGSRSCRKSLAITFAVAPTCRALVPTRAAPILALPTSLPFSFAPLVPCPLLTLGLLGHLGLGLLLCMCLRGPRVCRLGPLTAAWPLTLRRPLICPLACGGIAGLAGLRALGRILRPS
mmetsp:Transcript_7276/g.17255  ORF Transcript_7276/g.17255 Transcript_7276/m.17255 type:complete len:259 (-) Transcript_7276:334-1110(-)